MMVALVMVIVLIILLILLSYMLNQYLNDVDQTNMAKEYSKKAKQHNELMVRKESNNGSSSR